MAGCSTIANADTARCRRTLVYTRLHAGLPAAAIRHVATVEVKATASVERLAVRGVLAAVVSGTGDGSGAGGRASGR